MGGGAPNQVTCSPSTSARSAWTRSGFTAFRGSTGAMPAYMGSSALGAHSKIVEISDGVIHWSDALKLPIAPMIGFVGVAPRYEAIGHAWAGYYGGNFDVQEITTGATVQLAVNVPGAFAPRWRYACAPRRRRDLWRRRHRSQRSGATCAVS